MFLMERFLLVLFRQLDSFWLFLYCLCMVLKKYHIQKEPLFFIREVLQVPDDYRIGIVPASDTGAFEMAMWSVLGARGVEDIIEVQLTQEEEDALKKSAQSVQELVDVMDRSRV